MTVGNIDSTEKGSGARYNDGKPDYSLLILRDFARHLYSCGLSNDSNVQEIIHQLGMFQQTAEIEYLDTVLKLAGMDAIEESCYVFTYGAKKYKQFNWIRGMAWSVPLACAVRHSLAILNGEEYDSESGQRHLSHVVCNVFMLIHYSKYYKEGNDLPPSEYFK